MTPEELEQWAITANPKDQVIYHTGHTIQGLDKVRWQKIEVAAKALELCGQKIVTLVQRRVNQDGMFEYIAIRLTDPGKRKSRYAVFPVS